MPHILSTSLLSLIIIYSNIIIIDLMRPHQLNHYTYNVKTIILEKSSKTKSFRKIIKNL